jgi:hypothetical protein
MRGQTGRTPFFLCCSHLRRAGERPVCPQVSLSPGFHILLPRLHQVFFHSLPQPVPVTNNLDREFWKAQACRMHDRSNNKVITGSRSGAKSLFQNILAVSPCGSRFCPYPTLSRARKFLGMRILGKRMKKISRDIFTQIPVDRTRARLRPADSRGRLSPHFLSTDDGRNRKLPLAPRS